MLTKKGNSKIDKSCLIFNLPTSICLQQCDKCYARKAEIRFPTVLKSRNRNLEAATRDNFVEIMNNEIKKSKCNKFRIHESGDFFNQGYINKWNKIVTNNTNVQFYAYTKSIEAFDFSELEKNKNINIINSITPLGKNYGNLDHCNTLVKQYNYKLCPCANDTTTTKVKCMLDCNQCLTEKKICFKIH